MPVYCTARGSVIGLCLAVTTAAVAAARGDAEAIYWEARGRAKEALKELPAMVLNGTSTNFGDYLRVWDYFTPDYNCPLFKERVGKIGDGGKWVCGPRSHLLQGSGCVVYSLGSAGDTSFEDDLLRRTACEVHTFDPTLSKEIERSIQQRSSKLHFHSIGVGSSKSSSQLAPGQAVIANMQTLETIMSDLGHSWLSLLKVDIEMNEWAMLIDFYKASAGASLPATQLLVEFHFPGRVATVLEVFDLLLEDRFRVFSVEPNWYCQDGCCARDLVEFAFVKVSAHGQICAPVQGESRALVLPPGC